MPHQDKTVDDVISDSKEVIRKIRFLIDAHHETVPGLARGLGVLPETIQDVLDGQSQPSRTLVRRIADRFSLPIDFFTSEISVPVKPKRPVRKRSTATSGTSRKKSARTKSQNLTLAGVPDGTLLQQALIELLIQKGVISADEWNARVRLVARRNPRNS